jgi:hypothetical protein
MTAILIGAGLSGVVLGATSRLVFLLPAALMALTVAAVLIVRADVDLGFTALAATLLNGGFLLGIVMAHVLPRLSASPPWRVDETDAGFIVRDHGDRPLARVGFDGRPEADSLLTRDEAREIAARLFVDHSLCCLRALSAAPARHTRQEIEKPAEGYRAGM